MNFFFRYASIACLSLTLTSVAQAVQTFTITQGAPTIEHVDLGKPGASHGDLLAFEAPFPTKDGKKVSLSGRITTVSLPTGTGDEFHDRIGTIILDFGGIDSLVITGKSLYGSGQGEMKDNTPQVRAVTGGTGRFIGARSQISTTRSAAGSYEHVIKLVD